MSNAARKARQERAVSAARRRAHPAGRRRRRWVWAAAAAAAVALAGVITGLHVTSSGSAPGRPASAPYLPVGSIAPDGTFTTVDGKTMHVAALRGRPVLVWFVTTWCSSCQYGTHVIAQNIGKLRAMGVRVEEIELYRDMGQQGTPIGPFARQLAGAEAANPDWSFGVSSARLTRTYDPKSYLDIYYLLNASGEITYVSSSPGSTMPQLLQAAGKLA